MREYPNSIGDHGPTTYYAMLGMPLTHAAAVIMVSVSEIRDTSPGCV